MVVVVGNTSSQPRKSRDSHTSLPEERSSTRRDTNSRVSRSSATQSQTSIDPPQVPSSASDISPRGGREKKDIHQQQKLQQPPTSRKSGRFQHQQKPPQLLTSSSFEDIKLAEAKKSKIKDRLAVDKAESSVEIEAIADEDLSDESSSSQQSSSSASSGIKESLAQRRGKRNIIPKYTINKGACVQVQEDFEEELGGENRSAKKAHLNVCSSQPRVSRRSSAKQQQQQHQVPQLQEDSKQTTPAKKNMKTREKGAEKAKKQTEAVLEETLKIQNNRAVSNSKQSVGSRSEVEKLNQAAEKEQSKLVRVEKKLNKQLDVIAAIERKAENLHVKNNSSVLVPVTAEEKPQLQPAVVASSSAMEVNDDDDSRSSSSSSSQEIRKSSRRPVKSRLFEDFDYNSRRGRKKNEGDEEQRLAQDKARAIQLAGELQQQKAVIEAQLKDLLSSKENEVMTHSIKSECILVTSEVPAAEDNEIEVAINNSPPVKKRPYKRKNQVEEKPLVDDSVEIEQPPTPIQEKKKRGRKPKQLMNESIINSTGLNFFDLFVEEAKKVSLQDKPSLHTNPLNGFNRENQPSPSREGKKEQEQKDEETKDVESAMLENEAGVAQQTSIISVVEEIVVEEEEETNNKSIRKSEYLGNEVICTENQRSEEENEEEDRGQDDNMVVEQLQRDTLVSEEVQAEESIEKNSSIEEVVNHHQQEMEEESKRVNEVQKQQESYEIQGGACSGVDDEEVEEEEEKTIPQVSLSSEGNAIVVESHNDNDNIILQESSTSAVTAEIIETTECYQEAQVKVDNTSTFTATTSTVAAAAAATEEENPVSCYLDEERRAFDEDNFFDELTPISGPDEGEQRGGTMRNNSNFDFGKIMPVRSLITVQNQFLSFNTGGRSQQQQQQQQQAADSSQGTSRTSQSMSAKQVSSTAAVARSGR